MVKRSTDETFSQDRAWNTPPDADAPDDVKCRYQRELRNRWESMVLPSDILDFPLPTNDWWTDPYGIDPEYQRRRVQKQMARYAR